MRRIVSIVVLAVFAWQLAAPLLGPDPDATLPPCCRRHGKHHCAMSWMAEQNSGRPGFKAVTEKCPYGEVIAAAQRSPVFQLGSGSAVYQSRGAVQAPISQSPSVSSYLILRGQLLRGPPAPSA